MRPYEKQLWIELIGFDCLAPDYGVKDFLARMEEKPARISLLLWSANIIHAHAGLETDFPLGPQQCSYYARPYNEERKRQEWSAFALRGLIAELRKYGIAVYLCVCDQVMSQAYAAENSIPRKEEWIDSHPELFYLTAEEQKLNCICPWKRLYDGSLYEDFFCAQLRRVLLDYGFDGLHAADGFSHPRLPLSAGDFSDDVIGQFSDHASITVPPGETPERAAWILAHAKSEWRAFHVWRHGISAGKILKVLEECGKGHLFNTAWTRDPFEALIRYGVDYRVLADAGVREFVVEAQAAVVDLEGWNKSSVSMLDQYRSTTLRLKAMLPECRFFLLHCVKDGMEQYNALRHAPLRMEADVDSAVLLFHHGKRCLDGSMTCLADGIDPWEWRKIDGIYQKAFDKQPEGFFGALILWSDKAFRNEISAYRNHPLCSTFSLCSRLFSAGAVISGSASADFAHPSCGTLIVPHPGFWEKKDLVRILSERRSRILCIGLDHEGDFSCRVYENGKEQTHLSAVLTEKKKRDPLSWLEELPETMPEAGFFRKCARLINSNAPIRMLKHPDQTRLQGFFHSGGILRLCIGNERNTYRTVSVVLRGHYHVATQLTEDPSLPPRLSRRKKETVLSMKLPPCGTVILDLGQ